MAGWIDKSASNAILNVAPGISVGILLNGKSWTINVIGTKTEVSVASMQEAKVEAEKLLRRRLEDACSSLEEVSGVLHKDNDLI